MHLIAKWLISKLKYSINPGLSEPPFAQYGGALQTASTQAGDRFGWPIHKHHAAAYGISTAPAMPCNPMPKLA